jgi:hypothetical protein
MEGGRDPPTHRSGPKPARHWRTRKDPFETVWPRIVTWLEQEPDQTAKALLDRLQADPALNLAPASCGRSSAESSTGAGWPPAVWCFATDRSHALSLVDALANVR